LSRAKHKLRNIKELPFMSAAPDTFHQDRRAVNLPLWREALVGLDWLALRTSPVYFGMGVPHGDKSGVIVVPGFLGTDHYLFEMYLWLRRIGYTAYMSRIGWNAECLNVLTDRLSATIDKAYTETGRKVHLIGHSLGGILSRSIAVRQAEQVASVITLGSPIRGVRSHPLVLGRAEDVRKHFSEKAPRRVAGLLYRLLHLRGGDVANGAASRSAATAPHGDFHQDGWRGGLAGLSE
jgi:triacylglycerol esterase/lipase EstA (alpha/beta hydrolase family)